ncbi:hypothetical protein MBH78_00790 [Oceanimonas sp. NS1]|nr:hypothetical protein [Oceanimonas sp. NS1]
MYSDLWLLVLVNSLLALLLWWTLSRCGRGLFALLRRCRPNRYLRHRGVRRVKKRETGHE